MPDAITPSLIAQDVGARLDALGDRLDALDADWRDALSRLEGSPPQAADVAALRGRLERLGDRLSRALAYGAQAEWILNELEGGTTCPTSPA